MITFLWRDPEDERSLPGKEGEKLSETRKEIAARIIELCRERGWTPNHLAMVSGVSQSTIKSILNGESRNPGAVTLKKLCDGFGISLGCVFGTERFEHLE